MARGNDREITFEIREHLGIIGKRNSGWTKELNIVSWNGQEPPKFDIRDWNEDHTHMSKGVTLFSDEIRSLAEVYCAYANLDLSENTETAQTVPF